MKKQISAFIFFTLKISAIYQEIRTRSSEIVEIFKPCSFPFDTVELKKCKKAKELCYYDLAICEKYHENQELIECSSKVVNTFRKTVQNVLKESRCECDLNLFQCFSKNVVCEPEKNEKEVKLCDKAKNELGKMFELCDESNIDIVGDCYDTAESVFEKSVNEVETCSCPSSSSRDFFISELGYFVSFLISCFLVG